MCCKLVMFLAFELWLYFSDVIVVFVSVWVSSNFQQNFCPKTCLENNIKLILWES